ncbi:cyanophycin synthetase [Alicyclobacillus cellulosilyticus]|uniref:Cyanophycin synthetase n=1 Tax=Alicyclobacillus cellulosilyticus TaxID=1003997 RepID=A0A917NMC4_9BACL|nr:cyanophycin synthetase [Alicyclobacillus cellulosilyticus]GGJ08764.1 cyanophycin synthetase [Alicyclobacillus cellulosilyticus]
MKILSVRHIEGPNVYLYRPILIARLDLMDKAERETTSFPQLADHLLSLLPGLREHHCAKGRPGGFVERLYGGTYLGHVIEHVAIELACLAGLDVHFGKTVYAGRVGLYDVVMECKDFPTQKLLLQEALALVDDLAARRAVLPRRLADAVARARDVLARSQLGPSTQAIVAAALARGIPVRRLDDRSLLQLGYGCHRKWVAATMTEHTSAVAVDVVADKALTKQLLATHGIPVPDGEVAGSLEEALAAFRRLGPPVVVKPQSASQGRGVSLALMTAEEVADAYRWAAQVALPVLVERYLPGRNVRVLVVAGRYTAASERVPAHVVGDGRRTVTELVAAANCDPRRGQDHEKPLTRIEIDQMAVRILAKQGWTPASVPAAGQVVWLRDTANLSTGGEARDVTDILHPAFRHLAERAARLLGLDVCGVDLVIPEDAWASGDGGVVLELNAAPGIRMHLYPSQGAARDVGEAIVRSLFPGNTTGRIPIVAVTGTNGKTTTTRLIGHGLARAGRAVGMTTTGGIYIRGERVVSGDTTGPDSARIVLADPAVEVAVLETARGGIVRGGLGYDQANVAVLTNITLDHIGQDGAETLEDILHIKSLVAECVLPGGTVVLNADDPMLVRLSQRLTSRVVFFSGAEDNRVLARHLARVGTGYYVARGHLVEARGSLAWDLVDVRDVPLTMGGTARFHVENCLAAAAALRALGMTRQQVIDALVSFSPAEHNPGRAMVFELPARGRVVLDYGHNPDGFAKVGAWLRQWPHQRLLCVVGVPGDRADHVIRAAGRAAAEVFDVLVVKEDQDKRGRVPGEVAQILAREIGAAAPDKPCWIELDECAALMRALREMRPGDIVIAFYEHLDPLVHMLTRLGARQVTGAHGWLQPAAPGA